jgi:ATP-dependent phosphofructokinase / diphosphate-dependent phosphofructokinase
MNAIVIQCGGPTAVINASLAAVVAACQTGPQIEQLWGARLGLEGLVAGDWAELTTLNNATLAQLRTQPGAALGGGRYFLADSDLTSVLARFGERRIEVAFLIGGNGTMSAAQKLLNAAQSSNDPANHPSLQVIGIPKTVDNDLAGTDAAPGYASAARWVAQTVRDIGLDLCSMRAFDDVAVLEVMGRHAGWLAAAAALAREEAADPPDLILLPEVRFDEEHFLAAVHRIHRRKGVCLVVASEGIRDGAGHFVAEKLGQTEADAGGQKFLGLAPGVAPYLADLIRRRLHIRCRHLRPDTIQRSSSALVSETDLFLAEEVGRAAVAAARAGYTGVMMGLVRSPTGWYVQPVPFDEVVGRERLLPADFRSPDGWGVSAAFLAYARPLVGRLDSSRVQLS